MLTYITCYYNSIEFAFSTITESYQIIVAFLQHEVFLPMQ